MDEPALKALADIIGPDELAAVIVMLLETSPALCDELRRALAAGDAQALRAAAHQLKGSTSNLGAARLLPLCEELERFARAGDFVAAGPQVELVCAEYRLVHEALALRTQT